MKKPAQGFNTAAQDSNPGSRSRESEALHPEPLLSTIRACVHGYYVQRFKSLIPDSISDIINVVRSIIHQNGKFDLKLNK